MTGHNPNDHGPESFYLEGVDVDPVPEMVEANESFLKRIWDRLGWLLGYRMRTQKSEQKEKR